MRIFLTGGTGFIGGAVARDLRAAGHDVVAYVRSPAKAGALRALGCEIAEGGLTGPEPITAAAQGCDAAIHGAAIYRIGVPAGEADALRVANVDGTEHALAGLLAAGIPRIVYVSTVGVFGDTHGVIADETFHRDEAEGFLSVYDETKFRAHQIARRHIAAGAPIVIVQPAAVYGPGDHSELGATIKRAADGQLPALPFPDMGLSFVHVDDVAAGIVAALERGQLGEAYVLAGEQATMREAVRRATAIAGRRPPRFTVPTGLFRALAPAGRFVAPLLGTPPNLREVVRTSDGVTFYASHAKATRELGYTPRPLDDGLPSAL